MFLAAMSGVNDCVRSLRLEIKVVVVVLELTFMNRKKNQIRK